MAPLAAEALDLGDGHALDADGAEGVLDLVELEGLDDCGDELHDWPHWFGAGGDCHPGYDTNSTMSLFV